MPRGGWAVVRRMPRLLRPQDAVVIGRDHMEIKVKNERISLRMRAVLRFVDTGADPGGLAQDGFAAARPCRTHRADL